MDTHGLLRVYGFIDHSDLWVTLKYKDAELLRNPDDRWRSAALMALSDHALILLTTTNRLSQIPHEGFTTVDEVDLETIVTEAANGEDGILLAADLAEEVLDDLQHLGLVRSHKTMDSARYMSTYPGVARTERSYVAQDHEIDTIRAQGEGDTLDYKRHNPLKSPSDKRELVKDVISLANAGGMGPRYLLLGVEDDGKFYRPSRQDDADEHRGRLNNLRDNNLQQIISSWTTHSPSVRIAARGEHRDGPYVLLEITRNIAHLPYRLYAKQSERTSSTAHESGEVWIRKGSTNAPATPVEIAALEDQAARYIQVRSEPN